MKSLQFLAIWQFLAGGSQWWQLHNILNIWKKKSYEVRPGEKDSHKIHLALPIQFFGIKPLTSFQKCTHNPSCQSNLMRPSTCKIHMQYRY